MSRFLRSILVNAPESCFVRVPAPCLHSSPELIPRSLSSLDRADNACGVDQLADHLAHTQKVDGSSPSPATKPV